MYITCEQCSTIFRLDEKRLKPAGSKVRCCQCRTVFVAWPPALSDTSLAGAADMEDATAQYAAPSPAEHPEDTFDQELDGIDLAELDSILDHDRSEELTTSGDGQDDRSSAAEESGELDESDLDLDFESALALDDDRPADTMADSGEDANEALDLDMDFELDPEAASEGYEISAEDQLVQDDLEMDFELGDELDLQADTQEQNSRIDSADDDLGENIESVLDDFEDVLSEAGEVEGEASPGDVGGGLDTAEEEIDLSDLEDVLEIADETEAADEEEVDLVDIETALDAPAVEDDLQDEGDFDIDLSDLDMDLDDVDASEIEEEGSQSGLSLDDNDAIALEEEPAAVLDGEPAGADEAQGDEFDLSDLDGLMELDEEEGAAAEEATERDEHTDLSLDDDLSLDEDMALDEEAAPTGSAVAADEELLSDEQEEEDVFDLSDLDGLMELDEEEGAAAEETTEGDEHADLSLDDDLSLDEDMALDEEAAPTGSAVAADEELLSDEQEEEDVFDLSDLDGLMELDEEEGAAAEEATESDGHAELSLDDDLSLDIEEKPALETGTIGDAMAADTLPEDHADDLDLSDLGGLDTMLDDDHQEDDSELEELELSLDDEAEIGMVEDQELTLEKSAGGEAEEMEDLEFSLDSEFEDKPGSQSAAEGEDEDEELDLTDLEKMLENETLVPELSPQIQDAELSLPGGDEKYTDKEADALGLDSGAELDLSEIEAAIDSAEEDTDDGLDEDIELELDLESSEDQQTQEAPSDDLELELELDSDSAVAEGGAVDDDQEAIDLSDLNLSLEEEKTEVKSEIVNAGDIELEFQIEDEMEPATIDSAETMPGGGTTAAFSKTTVPADEDRSLIEEAFAEQPEAEKEAKKPAPDQKKKQQKKGSSITLIVILILILLGAGGYFGYQYAVKNNVQVPLLNDLINPQSQDPSGIAMLTTLDINSKFIENEKGGRIFVVTGKVRNGYPVTCNKIQLQGKLFSKGKVLAKTELAYAGVMINDLELAGQDVAQIKQRLKTGGGQAAELVVNPGQTLPFMVVFSELPADLDEFAIELLSSTKVQ